MSRALLNRNADLKRLREEGYFVQIRGTFLVMREVPYVNAKREVLTGTLVSSLTLAGDVARSPEDHKVWFDGEFPCFVNGTPIKAIALGSGNFDLGHGLTAKYQFSSKPDGGYSDYFEKMTTYAGVISGPAAVLKPGATPRTFRLPEEESDGVFNYIDTASDRAGIGALTELLASETIAIIGLGGTGSYILDMVAKTPVREIRLFDADEFLQHNAFRAPGAPSLDELREAPPKVEYFKGPSIRRCTERSSPTTSSSTRRTCTCSTGRRSGSSASTRAMRKRLIVGKLEATRTSPSSTSGWGWSWSTARLAGSCG